MAELLGYHHVSLSVTDLDKSADWYRQAFGLEVVSAIEGEGFKRLRLRAPGSGVTVTLTRHDAQHGAAFDERRAGLDHIAFNVGSVEAVQELKDRFERLGLDHSEIKAAATGAAMITLRDPDNVQLEVFSGLFDATIAAGRS